MSPHCSKKKQLPNNVVNGLIVLKVQSPESRQLV
jgi:hypothetical protein